MMLSNLKTWDGQQIDLTLSNDSVEIINPEGLLAMPAVLDPHVHFRTPGMEYKEDWRHASQAAIRGGCTMVFDMPNTLPPTITRSLLQDKKALIDAQLEEVRTPLRYGLFFGADKNHFEEIPLIKDEVVGIKVFMGNSTGDLAIDDDASLDRVFKIAVENNLLLAVHAEDEDLIKERKKTVTEQTDYCAHSVVRNVEVAVRAVDKAISLAKKHGTTLYILHVSTQEELALISQAKKDGITVYAETTPHHLFLDASMYSKLAGRMVVNPPIRYAEEKGWLFDAIKEGVIDTIGSDHAPHTLDEKSKPYGQCPSGMPGIEFVLPLLLNAYHQGHLELKHIVSLTSGRAKKMFNIQDINDWVLIDINHVRTVSDTKSKCGWTAYQGLKLKGWPAYTVMKGRAYHAHTAHSRDVAAVY